MDIKNIILAAIGVLNLIIAGVAYIRNRRSLINVSFAVIAASVAAWAATNALTRMAFDFKSAYIWAQASYMSAALIVVAFYVFSNAFPYSQSKSQRHQRLLLILAIGSFMLIACILLIPGFVILSIKLNPWQIITGPGLYVYAAYLIALFAMSFINLLKKFFVSKGNVKLQIKYVFLGTFVSTLLGVMCNLVLPLTGNYSFVWLGPNFSIVMVGLMAYAIVKHRLMDIHSAISKSIAFTLFLAVMGAFISLSVRYLGQIFQGFISRESAYILTAFIAIFAFQPAKSFVERSTDRLFAKGRYSFNGLLNELGEIISASVILEDLIKRTLDILVGEMRLTRAAIVLNGQETAKDIWKVGWSVKPKKLWGHASKLATYGLVVITDELAEGTQEKDILRQLGADVLVPLRNKEDDIGFMALGGKLAGEVFTVQDLQLLEIIAPEIAIAVEHAKLFKQKEMRIKELDALSRLALNLGSTLDLDHILEMIIDEAIAITGAENSSIMLLDEDNELLTIRAARGLKDEKFEDLKLKIGEGIAGWVAKTKKPALIIDGKHEDKYLLQCLKREDIRSSLTVPLKVKEKVIGVLSVNRKARKDVFTEESLGLINSCAAHAAQAIENARLYDNLEATFLGTISALVRAIDARDKYTYGHSEAVTVYAVAIAKKLDLSDREVRNIEIAGRLHDIGKIGIDDSILNKPDRLTEDEMNIIKQHPRIAVDILNSVEMLSDVIPYILYHHERYSGGGYPLGLSGTAIPLGARIIAVVDAFNAMVTNRPYMQARSIEKATDELNKCSGAQFDPMIVKVFIEVLRDEHNHLKDDRLLLDSEVPEKV